MVRLESTERRPSHMVPCWWEMIPNVPLRYEQQDSAELGLEVHLRDQNHVLSDMASYYPTFNLTAHTSISGAARPPVLLTTVDLAAPERLRTNESQIQRLQIQ